MNLEQLIQYLVAQIGKHVAIVEVDFGSEFDNDVAGNYEYPMCFIECDPVPRRRNSNGTIEYDLALLLLDAHKDGNKADALRVRGRMEPVIDELQHYLSSVAASEGVWYRWENAVSLTYATDSIAGGWRVEFTCTVNAERCAWLNKFED